LRASGKDGIGAKRGERGFDVKILPGNVCGNSLLPKRGLRGGEEELWGISNVTESLGGGKNCQVWGSKSGS